MDQPSEQHTEQGILKTVEAAGDVTVERALVGVVNGRDVSITQAGAGPIAAQGDVRIQQGGCGPVLVGGDLRIHQGGCGPAMVRGNLSIQQGGTQSVLAAGNATLAQGAFVGLVASHKRGEALLAYLAERGVPPHLLDRVRTPVGIDLGRTSHQEIAVAVLAELVQRRAAGEFSPRLGTSASEAAAVDMLDPVCGMTVTADEAHFPVEHGGTTYYFCCAGCSESFAAEPARYLSDAEA